MKYKPSWKGISLATNKKQSNESHIAPKGEGKNSKTIRSKNKKNRIVSKGEKVKHAIEKRRDLKIESGLHLCDIKCTITGSYCQKVFLTSKELNKHKKGAKHDFPSTNARDFLVREASKAGGSLALGSRPNRKGQALFKEIIPSSSPYEHEAHCYQRFNRIEIHLT